MASEEPGRSRAADLSPAKRALLEARRRGAPAQEDEIPRRGPGDPVVLSFAQERMWLLEQLAPGLVAYNTPRVLRLRGALDVDALHRALDEIVRRHDVLRTVIGQADGAPVPRIVPAQPVPLEHVDLSDDPDREATAERLVHDAVRRPFDLASDVLLRAHLVRFDATDHLLVLASHHIASDEPSKRILNEELSRLYAAFRRGEPSPLPELPLQYADYAAWRRVADASNDEGLAYWSRALAGAPTVLDLPADRPRPVTEAHAGAKLRTTVPAEVAERLREVARRTGATLFMTLVAGFGELLHRCTGQDDVLIGAPISLRSRDELQLLVGMFLNTVVLRVDLSGDPTFEVLVRRVKEMAIGAYAHQDVPFERVVEELRPPRDLSRNPLFQVALALRSGGSEVPELDELDVTPVAFGADWSKLDLTLIAYEDADGVQLVWEHSADLFDAATIEALASQLALLLATAAADPTARLSELPLMSDADQAGLGAASRTVAVREVSLPELVLEQARRRPDAPAVRAGDDALSYGELLRRALELAGALRDAGVGRGDLVGLWGERTVDLVVGTVGITAAGAAYVPLEPTYPADRLELIAEDAGLSIVVAPPGATVALRRAVQIVPTTAPGRAAATEVAVDPGDLAYVIYTSGSTGRPKGVAIEHRGVVNLLSSMAERPGLAEGETMLGLTTPAFDLSVPDLWLPLVTGARLVLASPEEATDPLALGELLDRAEVSLVQATPATWRLLLESGWVGRPSMRVVCGGEAYDAALARALGDRAAEVWNFYGPTECTVWVSAAQLGPETTDPLPLGSALPNTSLHVLDAWQRTVPAGVVGELYLGGVGLARGYHGQPELTQERFLTVRGERMYRTGDLVRRSRTGVLTFVGRADFQVKLRGFRIELGEVESALVDAGGVAQSVAVVREDTPGDPRLIAYVTAAGGDVDGVALRRAVAERLPAFMVPAAVVVLDALPLTPNGKLDRAALPEPGRSERGADVAYVAPRTDLERTLASIWEAVLGVARVGVRDDFFELGGHSLLGMRVLSRVERATGRGLPLATIFHASTIEGLAAILTNEAPAPGPVLALQPHGSRPPLFLAPSIHGEAWEFGRLAAHLGPDQPLFGLQCRGLDGLEPPSTDIPAIARDMVGQMRDVQPHGPYYLGGMCWGGIVAFEMAAQLSEAGEALAFLGLFDATPRGYRSRGHLASVRASRHARALRTLPARQKVGYVGRRVRNAASKVRRFVWWELSDRLYLRAGRPLPRLLRDIRSVNIRASFHHTPRPYPGAVHVFRAGEREGVDRRLLWGELAGGGMEVVDIGGPDLGHVEFLTGPEIELFGGVLRDALRAAQTEGGPVAAER